MIYKAAVQVVQIFGVGRTEIEGTLKGPRGPKSNKNMLLNQILTQTLAEESVRVKNPNSCREIKVSRGCSSQNLLSTNCQSSSSLITKALTHSNRGSL